MALRLATATVTARLSGQRGRAIVNAKGHHYVVDSPLTLGGPNEEINPIDLLLSSLATHGTFTIERVARENNYPLKNASMQVSGSFDPRGVTGEAIDPALQTIRARLTLEGVTHEQAQVLVAAFRSRCPVYATLAKAARIDLEVISDSVGSN